MMKINKEIIGEKIATTSSTHVLQQYNYTRQLANVTDAYYIVVLNYSKTALNYENIKCEKIMF